MKKLLSVLFILSALFTFKFAYSEKFDHVFLWQVRASVTEKEILEIKSYGVTTIQSTRLLDNSDDDIKAYLDLAAKHNLKVIPFLHIFVPKNRKTDGCQFSERGKYLVKKFYNHKAVYAWHTLDEPVQHNWTKKCQQDLHDFVKSVDPSSKVIISTNMFKQEHYDKYFEPNAVDIIDLHKYSNPVANWKQEQMLDMYKKNKPDKDLEIFITLRAFNAPHRKLRKDLKSDSMISNYNKLFQAKNLTNNLGIYGWNLNPNVGIQKSEDIKRQFIDVLKRHQYYLKKNIVK